MEDIVAVDGGSGIKNMENYCGSKKINLKNDRYMLKNEVEFFNNKDKKIL